LECDSVLSDGCTQGLTQEQLLEALPGLDVLRISESLNLLLTKVRAPP